MISFRVDSYRFHYRAAAIVRAHGKLLLHRLEGDRFWALPGGRVNAGEQAKDAIRREFIEELKETVHCEQLLCVGENFFEYGDEPHHEIGFYFSVSLQPTSSLLDQERVHIGVEADRKLEFKWFALSELKDIDMRPKALQSALHSGLVPIHFVQRHNAA